MFDGIFIRKEVKSTESKLPSQYSWILCHEYLKRETFRRKSFSRKGIIPPFKNTFTCTNTSCLLTAFMRIEKRDKSTPLGSIVASAKIIAAEMQPNMIAKSFLSCFSRIHRHINSAKCYQLLFRNRFILLKKKRNRRIFFG